MNRRSFLQSILALGIAPAIVRADALMRIIPRNKGLAYVVFEDLDLQLFEGTTPSLGFIIGNLIGQSLQPPRQLLGYDLTDLLLVTSFGLNSTWCDLTEARELSYIDCATLLSTAKEYELGLSTYTYQADIHLYLPEGVVFNPDNLRANGESVNPRSLSISHVERLIDVRGLPLEQYGNQVPHFTYVQPDRWVG